jgi:hypothetical protein
MKIEHQYFAPEMHRNTLRDKPIPPDAKTQVRRNVSGALFVESVPFPSEREK